jgi:hypothetical protein
MLEINALGRPEGAQVRLPLPGVYVGQFKGGKFSGQGAIVMSRGGYFGAFSDNTFLPDAVSNPGS